MVIELPGNKLNQNKLKKIKLRETNRRSFPLFPLLQQQIPHEHRPQLREEHRRPFLAHFAIVFYLHSYRSQLTLKIYYRKG